MFRRYTRVARVKASGDKQDRDQKEQKEKATASSVPSSDAKSPENKPKTPVSKPSSPVHVAQPKESVKSHPTTPKGPQKIVSTTDQTHLEARGSHASLVSIKDPQSPVVSVNKGSSSPAPTQATQPIREHRSSEQIPPSEAVPSPSPVLLLSQETNDAFKAYAEGRPFDEKASKDVAATPLPSDQFLAVQVCIVYMILFEFTWNFLFYCIANITVVHSVCVSSLNKSCNSSYSNHHNL